MRKTAMPRTAVGGTVKRSVTLGRDVDEQVRKLAGAGGFSAFMNDAALMALQAQGIRDWLIDFEAEHGAITDEEVKDARRRLAVAGAPADSSWAKARCGAILLDAGVFIGAAHGDCKIASLMKVAAASGIFSVAAHTVAEFYRGGTLSAAEAQLMNRWRVQFLDVTVADVKLAGELLARTGGHHSMDALLIAVGTRYQARNIFTGDAADLVALRDALPRANREELAIVDIRP